MVQAHIGFWPVASPAFACGRVDPQAAAERASEFDNLAGDSRSAWELMRFVSYDLPGYTREEIDAEFARMEELVAASRNRAWIPVLTEASAKGPVLAK